MTPELAAARDALLWCLWHSTGPQLHEMVTELERVRPLLVAHAQSAGTGEDTTEEGP